MRTAIRLTAPLKSPPVRPVAAAVAKLAGVVLLVPLLVLPVLTAESALAGTTASSGHEQFILIGHQADGSGQQVQATGVLTATGRGRVTVATPKHSVTRLVFRRGTVRLVTYPNPQRTSASVPDPSTCRFTEVVHGNYTVRGGTDRYQHAKGSGGYVTRIVGYLQVLSGGGCGSQLAKFWQRTRTWGSLRW
jgi:hypothetical protein